MGIFDRLLQILNLKSSEDEVEKKIKELEKRLTEIENSKDTDNRFETSPRTSGAYKTEENDVFKAVISFIDALKGKPNVNEIIKSGLIPPGLKIARPDQIYSSFLSDPTKHIFSELFKKIYNISDIGNPEEFRKLQKEIISSLNEITSTFDNKVKQYKSLDSLYHYFPIAKRIVTIYTNALIHTDTISNDYLEINENKMARELFGNRYDILKEEYERVFDIVREFVDDKSLIKSRIIPTLIRKGDVYIEVINKKEFLEKWGFKKTYVVLGDIFGAQTDNETNIKVKEEFIPETITNDEIKNEVHLLESKLINLINYYELRTSEKYINTIDPNSYIYSKYKSTSEIVRDILDTIIEVEAKKSISVELPSPIYFEEIDLNYSYDNKFGLNTFSAHLLEEISSNQNDENKNEDKNQKKKEQDIVDETLNLIRSITPQDFIRKIELKIHEPEYVIPLTDGNKIFGYLVVNPNSNSNLQDGGDALNSVIKKLGKVFDRISAYSNEQGIKISKQIYFLFINKMYRTLTEYLKKYIKKLENDTNAGAIITSLDANTYYDRYRQFIKNVINILENDKELKESLFLVLQDIFFEKYYSKVSIRFVPPDDMVHFYLQYEIYPYGFSPLSPVLVHSVMYMVSLYSNLIYRLSRAPIYTKFILEVGDQKNWESKLREFANRVRNKTLTLDDLGDLEKVGRLITDVNFMFEITRNGTPIVSQQLERLGDPSVRVQDIEMFKQDIALLTGIPSIYLGFVESDLREAIVDSNIKWFEQISSYQQNLEKSISKLFDLIFYKVTDSKLRIPLSLIFNIKMRRPIMLKLLQLSNTVSTAAGIVSTISQIPDVSKKVDTYKFLKKLVPELDWEEIELSGEENIKEKELTKLAEEERKNSEQQSGGQSSTGLPGGF